MGENSWSQCMWHQLACMPPLGIPSSRGLAHLQGKPCKYRNRKAFLPRSSWQFVYSRLVYLITHERLVSFLESVARYDFFVLILKLRLSYRCSHQTQQMRQALSRA